MKAVKLEKPREIALVELEKPVPGQGERSEQHTSEIQ